jgi:poly-gamma-glutamate synthesis protein (capsule biosynthesis protein)
MLISAGVDIIFGSHPHVLQPIVRKTVETEDAGQKEGPVVYSMGNVVSNQRKRFRDSGMIVNVTVVKEHDLGKAYIGDVTYVPTWVNRYSADGKLHYRILPVGVSLDTGLYKTHIKGLLRYGVKPRGT